MIAGIPLVKEGVQAGRFIGEDKGITPDNFSFGVSQFLPEGGKATFG